jgi:hypothetical protein
MITSVSLVVWKICPPLRTPRRSASRVDQVPVVREAQPAPDVRLDQRLTALHASDPPAVRVPVVPDRRDPAVRGSPVHPSTAGSKMWETSPIPVYAAEALRRSETAMPADSCPRCCWAYIARYVSRAASGCPQMATTPHFSFFSGSVLTALRGYCVPEEGRTVREMFVFMVLGETDQTGLAQPSAGRAIP